MVIPQVAVAVLSLEYVEKAGMTQFHRTVDKLLEGVVSDVSTVEDSLRLETAVNDKYVFVFVHYARSTTS